MERRYQINIVLSKEENDIISVLRDKYAINISGCFKLLIKNYWEQLTKKNIRLETKIL